MHHPNKGRRYVQRGKPPPELAAASAAELAWAAGYFEGEGSILVQDRTGPYRRYATPRMQANSVDEDVIVRLRDVLGGRVNFASQANRENRQDQWRWTLQGYEAVTAAFALMEPWLGARRTARFREVIAECDAVRAPLLSQ